MRNTLLIISLFINLALLAQNSTSKDSLSFIFIGDIMGHGTQIKAAHDIKTNTYNYESVFKPIASILNEVDYTIANLEVTLAGAPYMGYPQFSSPDELAIACKNSGMDVLVTANNHTCDRRKQGILRTLNVLDSLKIPHTGSFRNADEREQNNLLILDKNNIRVGLLNYTYGTNGIPVPKPTIVNLIDTLQMKKDIQHAQTKKLDKLIVCVHWGLEYQSHPSKKQKKTANFLFNQGVDIIIGSHPHVLQKMEYFPETVSSKERLIVYSLGNFVSNQRTRKRDGGAMFRMSLYKENGKVNITDPGYYLTWVNKPWRKGKRQFEILPCAKVEANGFAKLDTASTSKMKLFMQDSRKLLNKENKGINEIR